MTFGDLILHDPTSDPLRAFKDDELAVSCSYFTRATDLGFSLLDTPWVYTRFSMSIIGRPGVLDLAFTCTLLSPFFS